MNQPGPARPKVFQQLLSFVLAARNAFFSPTAGLQRTACVVVGQAHVGHMGREERKGRLTSLCLCFHVCQSKGLTGWQNRFLSLSSLFLFLSSYMCTRILSNCGQAATYNNFRTFQLLLRILQSSMLPALWTLPSCNLYAFEGVATP